MPLNLWFAFLIAAILISVSPGAGAVNTMSNGLRYGVRHTLPAILGLQLGYGAQILIVGVGLGAILATSELAFSILKWLGVGYLLWLGVQKWRQGLTVLEGSQGNPESTRKRFWQAAFVNLTNPKATVFLVALFPQFLNAQAPQANQFAVMGITLIIVDIAVMLGYALLASRLLRLFRSERAQANLNRIFGGLFIGAAGMLASLRQN